MVFSCGSLLRTSAGKRETAVYQPIRAAQSSSNKKIGDVAGRNTFTPKANKFAPALSIDGGAA
jgi:hypothetical protein